MMRSSGELNIRQGLAHLSAGGLVQTPMVTPMTKYLCCILLCLISLLSFGAEFEAGKDYEIIKTAQAHHTPKGAIQVTEFFNYGCPWCYRLEPGLNQWVKQQGAKINFKKIPVVFNKDWDYYARAYYTAKALSLNSTLDSALFKAILEDKKSLNNTQNMIDFLTNHGVNRATADSAFNHAPSIELKMSEAQRKMIEYQINAVPAIIINNQFKTDLQMAKTETRLFELLDYLLKKCN